MNNARLHHNISLQVLQVLLTILYIFPWYLQGLFALVRASLPTIVIVSFTLMTLMSDSGVMLLQEIRSKLFTLMGERAKIVVQALVFLRVDSAIL